MTLGKNFRLPTDVKPTAYDADLRLDLNADRFDVELAIDVALGAARRAITLHAVGLEVREASAEVGARTIVTKATADAESETVTLTFSEELPAGAARVRIAYRGAFSPGLRGLYRAGSIAVTQFEAADARRLFPCFDEPAFKAVWRLRVGGVPNQAIAISNGKVVRDDNDGSGGRRLTFAPTPPLSSYLVALIVGPLVVLRTRWAWSEACSLARKELPKILHLDLAIARCEIDPLTQGIDDRPERVQECGARLAVRE